MDYLKRDDRRLLAQEEYIWMTCFGAHMAALFVALDEVLPYIPAATLDFTLYLARARNHAEAIDKAFRFHLAFVRTLCEIKRVHVQQRRSLDASVDVGVAAVAGVAAKVSKSDGVERLSSELLALCEVTFWRRSAPASRDSGPSTCSNSLTAQTLTSYAGMLSQFAEFCHDSENISPLEATTATFVRYFAWIGERGGWTTNPDVVLDYIDPNVLPSPGAWFFFGHVAPLRKFQVQQDSAAVAFPVSPCFVTWR
eukprot:jgi/Tetstr1/429738/TSEL_019631.t1